MIFISNKNGTYKTLILGAIIISVLGLTLSFASYGSYLVINASSGMMANKVGWDVHFENLSSANISGMAVEVKAPIIKSDATVIDSFDVIFNTTNDSISYNFNIVNDGDFDAKITTLDKMKPICIGSGENEVEDTNLVCNNLEYTLTYANGTLVKVGDILNSKSRKSVILTLKYKGLELPVEKVKFSNLGITLMYSQN